MDFFLCWKVCLEIFCFQMLFQEMKKHNKKPNVIFYMIGSIKEETFIPSSYCILKTQAILFMERWD